MIIIHIIYEQSKTLLYGLYNKRSYKTEYRRYTHCMKKTR